MSKTTNEEYNDVLELTEVFTDLPARKMCVRDEDGALYVITHTPINTAAGYPEFTLFRHQKNPTAVVLPVKTSWRLMEGSTHPFLSGIGTWYDDAKKYRNRMFC